VNSSSVEERDLSVPASLAAADAGGGRELAPMIAIAGRIAAAGRVSRSAISFAGRRYLDAVVRAGGEPVTLAPRELRHDEAVGLLARFDALVLMGGSDVDPHLYGAPRNEHVYGVVPEQDHFEIALVHAALDVGMPLLAVCRGAQIVNVALGGSLVQHLGDLPAVIDHAPPRFPAGQDHVLHPVSLTPGCRTALALGADEVVGASFHHQGIARLGAGLRAVGHSSDGVIEALEGDGSWLVAVQWHPEDTAASDHHQQNLYDALVAEARRWHSSKP
jgi:putative glutamine amidotransferase